METRLVELKKFNTSDKRFFAKLEGENLSGSMKDRFVNFAIPEMEKTGKLKPGMTIVETSSGNTGIALARAGKKFGYKIVICIASYVSSRKKSMIKKQGAELIECDTSNNMEADIETAKKLAKQNSWYFFNQFDNPYHVLAYDHLAAETAEQLKEKFTGVKIDGLVAGVGTGASLIGLTQGLRKRHNKELRAYSVRPNTLRTKLEGMHPGHIRPDFSIWMNRPSGYEKTILIKDEKKAIDCAKKLCQNGFSAGHSSGAILAAALGYIKPGGNYLLLFADNAERYDDLKINHQQKRSTLKVNI